MGVDPFPSLLDRPRPEEACSLGEPLHLSPPLLLLVASGGKEWVVGWVRDLIHGRDSFSSSAAAASVAFGLNLVNGMSPTPEKKKTPLSVHKRGRGKGGGKE